MTPYVRTITVTNGSWANLALALVGSQVNLGFRGTLTAKVGNSGTISIRQAGLASPTSADQVDLPASAYCDIGGDNLANYEVTSSAASQVLIAQGQQNGGWT